MSAFLKQIKATGFDAIDTFDFRIWQMYGDYGGPAKYQEMVQDHGLERIVNTFHAADYDVRNYAPHLPETHENILEDFRVTMGRWSEIQLDNIIVMPATLYYDMEPITEDKLKNTAELLEQGRRDHRGPRGEAHLPPRVLLRHPERAGHRHVLRATPIPQYVSLFVDTAQHCIAGRRPGRAVPTGTPTGSAGSTSRTPATWPPATTTGTGPTPRSWRRPPASGSTRWARRTGLVDFEAMMTAVRDNGYRGWISVEHDKANKEGGDYSESTAISRWYAANVLEQIYRRRPMNGIRWAYAINQWKPQFDDFVRREQHERALKTISIAGFEGVELTAGTGRWEPLGNPPAAGRQLRLARRLPRLPRRAARSTPSPAGSGTRRSGRWRT